MKILIPCILVGLALLGVCAYVSPWLLLAYLACAIFTLIIGAWLIRNSPIDPEWAEEPPTSPAPVKWFQCADCPTIFNARGTIWSIGNGIKPDIAGHGKCPECCEKWKAELRARKLAEANQPLIDATKLRKMAN